MTVKEQIKEKRQALKAMLNSPTMPTLAQQHEAQNLTTSILELEKQL